MNDLGRGLNWLLAGVFFTLACYFAASHELGWTLLFAFLMAGNFFNLWIDARWRARKD